MDNEVRWTRQRTHGLVLAHRLRGHDVFPATSPREPGVRFWYCGNCDMAWRRFW